MIICFFFYCLFCVSLLCFIFRAFYFSCLLLYFVLFFSFSALISLVLVLVVYVSSGVHCSSLVPVMVSAFFFFFVSRCALFRCVIAVHVYCFFSSFLYLFFLFVCLRITDVSSVSPMAFCFFCLFLSTSRGLSFFFDVVFVFFSNL